MMEEGREGKEKGREGEGKGRRRGGILLYNGLITISHKLQSNTDSDRNL